MTLCVFLWDTGRHISRTLVEINFWTLSFLFMHDKMYAVVENLSHNATHQTGVCFPQLDSHGLLSQIFLRFSTVHDTRFIKVSGK